jgi:curved DNA-binding protein CbpA
VGPDTYYDILGVSRTATTNEIKARYRNVILRVHPDFDGPAALFRQVQEAYEVLSDPASRASYDRQLGSATAVVHTRFRETAGSGSSADRSAAYARRRKSKGTSAVDSAASRHPAGTVAISGAMLIVLGSALGDGAALLIGLGLAAIIVGGVAGLGGRGEKQREAYQRSGMTAVDTMTGRQFEVFLQHFFANQGYRVTRIGGRGEFGADLLLNDAHGRTIVQARRCTRVVPPDAVQHAVAAKAHYGAARALVVTSSDYSAHAVAMAQSNGVALWNRSTLAAELTVLRGAPLKSGVKRLSSELQTGSRICLGFPAAVFVALVALRARARRTPLATRRHR